MALLKKIALIVLIAFTACPQLFSYLYSPQRLWKDVCAFFTSYKHATELPLPHSYSSQL